MQVTRNITVVGGSRVIMSVQKADLSYGPYMDLGTVEAVSPTRTSNKIFLKDGSYGIARDMDTRTVETSTTFTIKTFNLGPENWQLFLGSESIATFSQTGETITDEAHTNVWLNSVIRVMDGADRVYDISSVTVKFGAATLTQGTHWDADDVDLKNGLIRLLNTAPTYWVGDGTDDITITYTKAAITSSARLLVPGEKLDFNARMMLVTSDGGSNDQNQYPWEDIYVKVSGNAMELPTNNFGSITLTATILAQNTATPEGSMKVLGPIVPSFG